MEAIADAGEVALSPELAARLDPACVGDAKEDALLLAAAPEVASGPLARRGRRRRGARGAVHPARGAPSTCCSSAASRSTA